MDIARPEFKQRKRRRQIAIFAVVVVVVALLTAAVYRLKPAAPTVERGTVWTDSVKRGSMLRQVHGIGSLVPSQESVLQIPAETEATVLRIRMLPGSLVKSDTILLEMSNPQVEQAAVDAHLQWKAAEAEYQSQRMKLESDFMNQKAGAATVTADYNQAQFELYVALGQPPASTLAQPIPAHLVPPPPAPAVPPGGPGCGPCAPAAPKAGGNAQLAPVAARP